MKMADSREFGRRYYQCKRCGARGGGGGEGEEGGGGYSASIVVIDSVALGIIIAMYVHIL